MERWRAFLAVLDLSRIAFVAKIFNSTTCPPPKLPFMSKPIFQFFNFRSFSVVPSATAQYASILDDKTHQDSDDYFVPYSPEDENVGKIPIKAYFLCTSIDLKSMQAENLRNIVPATSHSTNSIALRFFNFQPNMTGIKASEITNSCQYMIVFHYGSIVLFNMEDREAELYL